MTNQFAGILTGKAQPATPAPSVPAAPTNAFAGVLTGKAPAPVLAPKQPVAPISPVAPASGAVPVISPETTPNAFKGNLGGGYGASTIKDNFSGKPLLTYENQSAKSSQLLSDRVAPTFDPTIPQRIDPSVLHNGRMPVSASEAVRKATGAEPDEQLDHLISLELGGSNDTSNLNLEKLKSDGTQPSLTLENQTAKQVASGKISYIDGQKIIARAKGVQLPDDATFASSPHPLASGYPKPAPNQVGTQAQTQKVTAGDIAVKLFPSTLQTLSELQLDPLSLKADPSKALADRTKSMGDALTAEGKNISDFFDSLDSSYSAADRVGAAAKVAIGGVNAVLSPVTSLFAAANDIPVVGSLSRLVGAAFNAVGEGATVESKMIASHTIDKIPGISDDSKSKLTDAFGQIYSLAAQFSVGASAEKLGSTIEGLKSKFSPADTQTIIDKARTIADGDSIVPTQPVAPTELTPASVPLETPPPKPPASVETSPESSLPSWAPPEAQRLATQSGVRSTNASASLPDAVSARPGDTPAVPSKSMPAGALRPIEGIGDTKTRGLSSGVLDKAIANTPSRLPGFAPDEAKVLEQKQVATKLADTFGDLPQYKTMDIADQGARAIDLFQKDPEGARQIAYGAKAPPKGLTPEAVFIAVEQDAIERGDGQTLRELANSRLTSEATTMGQRLRMLGERNPESPTEAVRSVQTAREEAAQAKSGGKNINVLRDTVASDVTKNIARETAKPRDWNSFVESITC